MGRLDSGDSSSSRYDASADPQNRPNHRMHATAFSREVWDLSDAVAYLERFREIDPDGCFIAQKDGQITGAIFSFSYPWHKGS